MINKDFFDQIFRLLFSKISKKDNSSGIADYNTNIVEISLKIKDILSHYRKIDGGIPLKYKEFGDFLIKVSSDILENNYNQIQLINILQKYRLSDTLKSILDYCISIPITESEYYSLLEVLELKSNAIKIFKDKEKILEYFEKVDNNTFSSIDDMINSFGKLLGDVYLDFVTMKDNVKVADGVQSDKSFPRRMTISPSGDNKNDGSIKTLLSNYFQYRRNIRTLRSGFYSFDNYFSNYGYESGRLYILTGVPGSGKSIFLLESIVKSALFYDSILGEKELIPGKKNLYIYLTAENQIYETLMRYSSMIVGCKTTKLYEHQTEDATLKINEKATFKNSAIEIMYVDSYQTTISELMVIVDRIIHQYERNFPGEYTLRGIYVDYLDLFTSGTDEEVYRLELGKITMGLKKMGIHYNVPVITLTQMNDYYIDGKTKKPSLSNLTESRKKAEHADCVMFMYENPAFSIYGQDKDGTYIDKRDAKCMTIHTVKNRDHQIGTFDVIVNYDNKRMYDVEVIENRITQIDFYNQLFNYKPIHLSNGKISLTVECDDKNNKLNISMLEKMIRNEIKGDGTKAIRGVSSSPPIFDDIKNDNNVQVWGITNNNVETIDLKSKKELFDNSVKINESNLDKKNEFIF
jgi:replicative DNA helicase